MLLLSGCGPHAAPCVNTFIGSASDAPAAIVVVSDGISPPVDVHAGDAVPLVEPPQGGDVLYASARVKNVNRCGVTFRGRLSDPASGVELGFESRSADLVVGSDGWGRAPMPLASYFTNIPVCPDNNAFDLQGRAATLTVTAIDRTGLQASASQAVVPTCAQSDATARALCVCDCSAAPDGGVRMCGRD